MVNQLLILHAGNGKPTQEHEGRIQTVAVTVG